MIIMKKNIIIYLLGLMVLMPNVAIGQGYKSPRPPRYTVNFESQHGESFTVFIDGDIMNRMPQSRVMVNDVSDRTHEVVVVLRRPAQKAAVLNLLPGEPNIVVKVNYDQQSDEMMLYTPSCNLAKAEEMRPSVVPGVEPAEPRHVEETPHHNPIFQEPVEVRRATEEDVSAMVARMRKQTFDSDRLALGKVIVASANLTAGQIAQLAETIDFSSSQVDFLKYAYHYCIDKVNYRLALDVLTFSSDKKKVMDYISRE